MSLEKETIDNLLKKYSNPADLLGDNGLIKGLIKRAIEVMLEAEMTAHLGYECHSAEGNNSGNSRNGKSYKKVITECGETVTETPRDRNGTFNPVVLPKGQRRLVGFDEKVISLYALGTTVADIQYHLKEIYGVDVSHDLISKITDEVLEDVKEWQSRPLLPIYSIVYLDALWVKVRENNKVQNKAVYVALGVDMDGNKDVLGLWIDQSEGAKFWMKVVSELQCRGVNDILICCVDGLKGFPEAIEAIFPYCEVQVCIVHMIRNSFKYVPRKNSKEFMVDLKSIYTATTRDAAELALKTFSEKWEEKYPKVVKSWNDNWERLSVMFDHSKAIRRLIYTTNPIESLNASLRKVTKQKRVFPNDQSVFKQLYLAIIKKIKSWKGGIQGWREIYNQLNIQYEDRIENAFTQKN